MSVRQDLRCLVSVVSGMLRLLAHMKAVVLCNRVWNKGDGRVKLICMAPKLGAPGVPVNNGPTIGVNTSDRNSTETDDALEKVSSSKADSGSPRPSSNGNKSNGGDNINGRDGSDGQESIGSQLQTDVGSLHLTAPGTFRDDTAQSNSEDEGSIDGIRRAEQQERLTR